MEDTKKKKSVYETLAAVNVMPFTEKKEDDGLTYLSWATAWAMVMERYPDSNYRQLPYQYDENFGIMVHTEVTIEGVTREMWMPVMDKKYKAMKAVPYTYKTRYGDKTVEAATMHDINTAYMRCLAKNIAMFGLGIKLYVGEDIPSFDTKKRIEECKSVKELNALYVELDKDEQENYLVAFREKKEKLNAKKQEDGNGK